MTQSIATPLLIRSKKSASQITREGRESGLSTFLLGRAVLVAGFSHGPSGPNTRIRPKMYPPY